MSRPFWGKIRYKPARAESHLENRSSRGTLAKLLQLPIFKSLDEIFLRKYFNFIVTRIVPDEYDLLNKIDQIILTSMKPIAHFLAGRILLAGQIKK